MFRWRFPKKKIFFDEILLVETVVPLFNIATNNKELTGKSSLTSFCAQGRSQDFSNGGSQRLLTRSPSGDHRLNMVYTAAFPTCISGLSRIIAASRPLLIKDKSR